MHYTRDWIWELRASRVTGDIYGMYLRHLGTDLWYNDLIFYYKVYKVCFYNQLAM